MDASLWVAKTGLDAQQTRMNVISNNLANVNTTGFKRDRAVFEDLLYQNIRQAGGQTGADTQAATGFQLGTGVRVMATEKIVAQGNMQTTENSLDIAIAGDGYFQIAQPDGTIAYTRRQLQSRQRWTNCDQLWSVVAASDYRPGQRLKRHHRSRRHGIC